MKREKKQVVDLEAFEIIREERDTLQRALKLASADVSKLTTELQKVTEERDDLQGQLHAARRENTFLQKDREALKKSNVALDLRAQNLAASCTVAIQEVGAQKAKVRELEEYVSLLKTAQDERDVARREADYLRKRAQEVEVRAVQFQDQTTAQEEVIERLKAQNARFVEEQREAKKRADAAAASLIKTREEVAALKIANDHISGRLARVTSEKNALIDSLTRERDELQADYDARGKVIKKLRKRLHKLKKKLKH